MLMRRPLELTALRKGGPLMRLSERLCQPRTDGHLCFYLHPTEQSPVFWTARVVTSWAWPDAQSHRVSRRWRAL